MNNIEKYFGMIIPQDFNSFEFITTNTLEIDEEDLEEMDFPCCEDDDGGEELL